MVGLTFCIVYAAGALPWAPLALEPGWEGVTPSAFSVVFTQATKIQIASMFAFLLGNLTDISVFFLLKKATGNRMLWLRSTGSTAVSQLIDTVVISAIIWGQKCTFSEYVTIVLTSYFVKLLAAILVTPVIYALHELIEKRWKLQPAPVDDVEPPAARALEKTASE
jgi:uncharacterized integral membrane protein (TIGR00697 family)